MAPRRNVLRWIILVAVAFVIMLLGASHSLSAILQGSALEVDYQPNTNQPIKESTVVVRNRQHHETSKLDSSSDVHEAQKNEAHAGGSSDVATVAPSTAAATQPKVWNFTHHKSRGDAVRSVRGHEIEAINPYLKKKSGGRWIGIHPTDLRLQLLLPKVTQSNALSPQAKLVYIDLGARMYPGSTGWFLKHYPRSREFGVILFELLDLEHTYTAAKPYFRSFTYERKAAWTHGRGVQIKGMRMARVDDQVIVQRGDNRQTWNAPSVDMAAYIMSNFTKDDFVALKLDIEGGEWTLIPHLIRTGAMDYIDELFLECHPIDFDDYTREPNRLPSVCVDFINDLRAMGVYCHRWF